jgi:hypothetical protein
MSEEKKSYQIQVTTADGQKILWKKQGRPAQLPEELVDTWVNKFRTDIWEITAEGEMVGVGRATGPTLKIVKVEKAPG